MLRAHDAPAARSRGRRRGAARGRARAGRRGGHRAVRHGEHRRTRSSSRPGTSAAELLRDADGAMYRAKARGRDCVEAYAPGAHETTVLALRTATELRRGIGRGEIVPYYQPIVELTTGHVVGFEALARWLHPERGLLGARRRSCRSPRRPGSSARSASRSCATRSPSSPAGGPGSCRSPQRHLSVNVGTRQVVDPAFAPLVAEILAETGIPADSLWLEITETALLADVKASTVALRNLRSLGLHLAVDDFGTGYSSLTYLKRFPVEAIKIDRGFVAGLGLDSRRHHDRRGGRQPRPLVRHRRDRRGPGDAAAARPAAGDRVRPRSGIPVRPAPPGVDRRVRARRRRLVSGCGATDRVGGTAAAAGRRQSSGVRRCVSGARRDAQFAGRGEGGRRGQDRLRSKRAVACSQRPTWPGRRHEGHGEGQMNRIARRATAAGLLAGVALVARDDGGVGDGGVGPPEPTHREVAPDRLESPTHHAPPTTLPTAATADRRYPPTVVTPTTLAPGAPTTVAAGYVRLVDDDRAAQRGGASHVGRHRPAPVARRRRAVLHPTISASTDWDQYLSRLTDPGLWYSAYPYSADPAAAARRSSRTRDVHGRRTMPYSDGAFVGVQQTWSNCKAPPAWSGCSSSTRRRWRSPWWSACRPGPPPTRRPTSTSSTPSTSTRRCRCRPRRSRCHPRHGGALGRRRSLATRCGARATVHVAPATVVRRSPRPWSPRSHPHARADHVAGPTAPVAPDRGADHDAAPGFRRSSPMTAAR